MDSKTLEEVKAFLSDVVVGLTDMHVKASKYLNAPHDQDAVDALAAVPADLIARAQALSAQLGDDEAGADDAKAAKPAPKAKAGGKS